MSLFDSERNAFQNSYDKDKAKRVAEARRLHAEAQKKNMVTDLIKENEVLRKKLSREQKKLAAVKAVAVSMHYLATRMNSATPRDILNWSDKIMNLINGKS
jgi:Tfp pilus assembly protein FimV